MSTESFVATYTGLWKNSCLELLSMTLGTVGGKGSSSSRSPIVHTGKEDISGGHSVARQSSASPTTTLEPFLCENQDPPGCGSTSQDLSRKYLTFSQITLTHLHTARCSPSKTGLCTGADTRQRWCLHQTAARLAGLPLASYTGYTESALDPHKPSKRNDRLPIGIKCRKHSKDHIHIATNGNLLLNQNHVEKFTRHILSEYCFLGGLYKAQGEVDNNICEWQKEGEVN